MPTKITAYRCERTGNLFESEEAARLSEDQIPADKEQELLQHIASGQHWRPQKGDVIYVGTHLYIDHGEDDVVGGLAIVSKVENGVSAGRYRAYVEVGQHPGCRYNWEFLWREQKKLHEEYGNKIAHPDPDYTRY